MSVAETPAEDEQPPPPLPTSFEVPMEAVPARVVPRLELAVRVPPPPPPPPVVAPAPAPAEERSDELPMEPVPVVEPMVAPLPEPEPVRERQEADPRALPPKALEPAPSAVTQAVESANLADLVDPVPPARPAHLARPVRAAQSVRPVELDRRRPVKGLLGLVVVVVFGAIALSLAVGAAIAAVLFAVRGGVGG